MRYAHMFRRIAHTWILTTVCFFADGGTAWAQAGGGEGRGASPWVMSYALVLLGVVLGLLVLCKPTKRRDKPKVEQ